MALLLGDIVRRQARHRPDRIAYVIGGERVAYRQLNALVNRLAHTLCAHGIQRGDRVATLAPNRLEYPAIYFAVAKLGAIHVPVNFRYRAGEVRYVLSQSAASLLLYADEFAGIVEEVQSALPALRHAISLDRDAPALLSRASDAFTMLGYWRMPEATAEAFRGGWLHTGDLAAVDDDGFLHIAGRVKEMIKCGGENVFPAEVERCLLEHEAIAEAAVFGVPDPHWGEVVVAAIVQRPGAALDEEQVIAHVRARLAGYKKPRFVRFLDALPRTASTRQVQKTLLREEWTAKQELQ